MDVLRIKRSEFIGFLDECESIEQLDIIVKGYKRKYHDAKQVCYAAVIDKNEYFNDDKEPNGTAGTSILNILKRFNENNKLIVVVRYFGGVKLGRKLLKESYENITIKVLKNIKN